VTLKTVVMMLKTHRNKSHFKTLKYNYFSQYYCFTAFMTKYIHPQIGEHKKCLSNTCKKKVWSPKCWTI